MAIRKKSSSKTKGAVVVTKPKFTIFATVQVDVTKTIEATSLAEAAQIAATLKPADFITAKEDLNDWETPKVYSVCSN